MTDLIKTFFSSAAYAVAGVSANPEKYGNKVFRCLLSHYTQVYPIHPVLKEVEGVSCLQSISELPANVESLSIITPAIVTEKLVEEAYKHGIKNIWMQPGAESKIAIEKCHQYGINVIAGGPCILVKLGWLDH